MSALSIPELIPVLQVAVGPVVLVSGVGLLMLSMTNRLGRTIDRTRVLVRELPALASPERAGVSAQLQILLKRAELLRRAIILASISVLFAAGLTIVLFLTFLLGLHDVWVIGVLFIGCMVCLIASLIVFIQDINQSLVALKLDLKSGCSPHVRPCVSVQAGSGSD